MYVSTLSIVMQLRDLNQSDIARLAGTSRQAVSLWFKSSSDFQNIRMIHGLKLARELGVGLDELTIPFTIPDAQDLFIEFCWDRLYPSIAQFLVAVVNLEARALARLVQCRGLYEGASIAGPEAWARYHEYRKYLIPARRKETDHLWTLHTNLMKA